MQVGDRFPLEDLGLSDGKRPLVVYFDPQAGSPKCTREATEFSLVNQDVGCLDVTQFVGVIPPGRAPMHSHSYDEIVYVIDGEGTLHFGGRQTRSGLGQPCICLPSPNTASRTQERGLCEY